jgi:hypothetical protein
MWSATLGGWSNECSEPRHTEGYYQAHIDIPGKVLGLGGINAG